MKYSKILLLLLIVQTSVLLGQEKEASPFDFGRMWTFENPPIEWFDEAYGLDLDQAWFDDVRKSSLRFATWCSASFVSPDGLIMTNHHCSRDVAISIQNAGENFDNNGFYATQLSDERRAPNLFVEQLIQVADITEDVKQKLADAENDAQKAEMTGAALEEIKNVYAEKENWKNLRLQTVSYYSGGKYSLYGYKKYDDIRLVLIPENDLGFYGGDPDNFTYPRYNLDFTFWRAYDENGEPLNTSEFYYEFNPDGIEEGIPVFVVGNPGSTERYRTVAQLEYDRDHRYKYLLRWLTNRRDLLQEEYDAMSTDPEKEREAQELLGTINNLSNSIKAYNGIMKGLNNNHFMKRKQQIQDQIQAESSGLSYWEDLKNEYKKLIPHSWAVSHLGPTPYRGQVFIMMHQIAQLKENMNREDVSKKELEEAKASLASMANELDLDRERKLLKMLLTEIKQDIYPGDNTLSRLLDGKSINVYVDYMFKKSKMLKSEKDAMKCVSKDKNLTKSKDDMIKAADILVKRYQEAATAFGASTAKRRALEAKIANQAFKVFGNSLPPDATFTLRISDGVVKPYEYNGTVAPVFTTYFGLYDRHYSHGQVFPWSLPERWQNPSMELLKSPLNLVSTNDITGGNSGSALINQKGEAVGLIFDGNIESLPGNFIYDEQYNRTVSVHAGGIYAAMKYIYKADRIINELMNNYN
jgi:hypothetical protein